jgi:hypothetical protein
MNSAGQPSHNLIDCALGYPLLSSFAPNGAAASILPTQDFINGF